VRPGPGRPFAWRSDWPPIDASPWPFGPDRRYSSLPIAYEKSLRAGGNWEVYGLGEGVGSYPARTIVVEGAGLKSLSTHPHTHPLSPITAIPSHRQRPTMKHQRKQGEETKERANIEASQAGI